LWEGIVIEFEFEECGGVFVIDTVLRELGPARENYLEAHLKAWLRNAE